MTNEEAMQLIRNSGNQFCVVEWSLARNEIVAVREFAGSVSDADGPCVGRFVDVRTVSLETLRAQQEQNRLEELETVERARIRQAWQVAPIDELLDLLEAEKPPRDLSVGAAPFMLETFYYARSATLLGAHIKRLNAIAEDQSFTLGSRNAAMLGCYLAVIEDNPARFLRYWDGLRLEGKQSGHFEVMIAAGDLQIHREEVLKYLVGNVAKALLFMPRFDSMIALGKIGHGAGEAAASTIEQHIYESSDLVASVRRLAIARIRSASDEWRRCDTCVRGRILNTSKRVPWFALCSKCFGLAHVPVENSLE